MRGGVWMHDGGGEGEGVGCSPQQTQTQTQTHSQQCVVLCNTRMAALIYKE